MVGDIYYRTMQMRWPTFVGSVSLVFLVLNLVFGAIYAALPGAIVNMPRGSLLNGFFFSVETLGTVGYGNMAPVSPAGHCVAGFEILIGLFFSATMTGLIFARFARPRTSLMFSRLAVIGRHEGRPALMVRVASTRRHPLADASAQMAWLQRIDLPDGRVMRRLVDLPLLRSHNAMLGLAWSLIHVIEDESEFAAALTGTKPFSLTVTVSGLDTLLASQSIGGHFYRREDILIDHEFVDVISDVEGVVHLDLAHFHEARPI
jgi:inward rectifier potassium channel